MAADSAIGCGFNRQNAPGWNNPGDDPFMDRLRRDLGRVETTNPGEKINRFRNRHHA